MLIPVGLKNGGARVFYSWNEWENTNWKFSFHPLFFCETRKNHTMDLCKLPRLTSWSNKMETPNAMFGFLAINYTHLPASYTSYKLLKTPPRMIPKIDMYYPSTLLYNKFQNKMALWLIAYHCLICHRSYILWFLQRPYWKGRLLSLYP